MTFVWLMSPLDSGLTRSKRTYVDAVVLPGLAEHEYFPIQPIYPRARGKRNPPMSDGLIDQLTDLRVLITISKHLATGCDLDQLTVSMLRHPR